MLVLFGNEDDVGLDRIVAIEMDVRRRDDNQRSITGVSGIQAVSLQTFGRLI